jgi:hypothetical protein
MRELTGRSAPPLSTPGQDVITAQVSFPYSSESNGVRTNPHPYLGLRLDHRDLPVWQA